MRKGKFAYMSPEQVAGEPLGPPQRSVRPRHLLAELLTGQRPFDGDDPLATMENIRRADPPALAALPAPLRGLLRRCLAPLPADRFATAELLRGELSALRRTSWHAALPTWPVGRVGPAVARATAPRPRGGTW